MDISMKSDQGEPETTANSTQDTHRKNKNPHKKQFHGKKRLYEKLKDQMEFYFSPSNVAKDRYMSKLLEEDQCKFYPRYIDIY